MPRIMSEEQKNGSMDDLVNKLYNNQNAKPFVSTITAPIYGAKEYFTDPINAFKNAKNPNKGNLGQIATSYAGNIAGSLAGLAATRATQNITAHLTGTQLSPLQSYNFFDFKGLFGYEYLGSSATQSLAPLGYFATSTLPYILPVMGGTYLMAKGIKNKSPLQVGLGIGSAGVPLFSFKDSIFGIKALSSYIPALYKTIASSAVLSYGFGLAAAFAMYYAGKRLIKGTVSKILTGKKHNNNPSTNHKEESHVPASINPTLAGAH